MFAVANAVEKIDRVWERYPERKECVPEFCKKIRPVVRFTGISFLALRDDDGVPFYIRPVDPFDVAYTWDPKPGWRARGLLALCDITTYHTYGYYGCFKPSIAEVIAQIPADKLNKVVAFEIVDAPRTAEDFNRDIEAFHDGYHVATTRLYTRK